jgi:hypothetical protein
MDGPGMDVEKHERMTSGIESVLIAYLSLPLKFGLTSYK